MSMVIGRKIEDNKAQSLISADTSLQKQEYQEKEDTQFSFNDKKALLISDDPFRDFNKLTNFHFQFKLFADNGDDKIFLDNINLED